MKINVSHLVSSLLGILVISGCQPNPDISEFRSAISVNPAGNSWITSDPSRNNDMVSDSGIVNWSDSGAVISSFFRTERSGNIRLGLVTRSAAGRSVIAVNVGGTERKIRLKPGGPDTVDLGSYSIEKPGYATVSLRGIWKNGPGFPDIRSILLLPDTSCGRIWYVKDDFYWGRRGPSVHIRYSTPEASKIEWFYNEIMVPEGNDIKGSFFMANGFTDGYFGIQVNSDIERRVLFSVWSPYKTDNPRDIPEEYRVRLLRKGEEVHSGEFGNEGSGGQSYFKYMWKAGVKYCFLLRGRPLGGNSTEYTAWFRPADGDKWMLIASFLRPGSARYLGNLHSFLENFHTETGAITRQALYSGQWICDTEGRWSELTSARFTADATARKGSRLDYAGGTAGTAFFLRNCGFFDETTTIGSDFSRDPSGIKPEIDLSGLK